jgi:hypothetical protein
MVEKGIAEDKIPKPIRYVECEVLFDTTPLGIARLAAGQHQRTQDNTHSITTADALSLFMQTAQEKRAQSKGRRSAFLSDAEIFDVVQQCGIVWKSKRAEQKSKSTEQQVGFA